MLLAKASYAYRARFAEMVRLLFSNFTPAVIPPFAAHYSDTQPRDGSESQNRASVALSPFAAVTISAFAKF